MFNQKNTIIDIIAIIDRYVASMVINLDKAHHVRKLGRPQRRQRQGLPLGSGAPAIPGGVFASAVAIELVALPTGVVSLVVVSDRQSPGA